MYKLIIGLFLVGNSLYGECFVKDGLYINTTTKLMWNEVVSMSDVEGFGVKSWACRDTRSGGYSDWRFPNVNELMTIRDSPSNTACSIQNSDELYSSTQFITEDYSDYYYNLKPNGQLSLDEYIGEKFRCVRDIK